HLIEEVQSLQQVDACALLLPDESGTSLAFYAATGWRNDPVARGRKVPADGRSGAGLVMRTQAPLLVEDLEKEDPTSYSSKWLRAEQFRGHAVIPLIAEDRSIGALVISTRTPRLLNEDEVRLAQLLANQAAIAIENARLREAHSKNLQLERELAVGQQIQDSMLPERCPELSGWEFCATYCPARMVSGDFYDFFFMSDHARSGDGNRLGIVIADVAGKGVPAAIFMALSRTMIRTVALSGANPAHTLERANDLIIKDSRAKIFLSAFYAILDTDSGQITFSSAGHNSPLWLRAGTGTCQPLEARGIVLGVFEAVTMEEHTAHIEPGDVIIFYTDGVTEAMNANHELFGEARLRAVIDACGTASAPRLLEAVVQAVRDFTGDTPQADDFTLVVAKRLTRPSIDNRSEIYHLPLKHSL
ncbi:MAG: GAF domain-containing SpoIIE family protein phosphatase, partial [Anaerolineae bacterium]|nr:GAF domain-containing SpoIIE family protein phosphatase [Anaerolineae bacterium]